MRRLVSAILLGCIRLYQLVLSPFLGASCRYNPTCSAYAIEAIRKWGPWKGGSLAVKRIGILQAGRRSWLRSCSLNNVLLA